MSHHTLERVFVRMLFDPALVDAVYADPALALAGLDLEPAERAQLVAVDRRAWRHDPLRRRRTLRTLADEFKSSATLALAATRSLASLDAFFSSTEFHDSIQNRGSLALAFSAFLERMHAGGAVGLPQFPDVLRLETMLARCRRDLGERGPAEARDAAREGPIDASTVLGLAPGHAVDRFNANVIEAVNVVERYLFEVGLMPAVALCADAPRLDALPAVAPEPSHLLALPSSSGVSLMPIDADYFHLLDEFSAGPVALGVAAARAIERGVPREDVDAMVESLVGEQVLVGGRGSGVRGRGFGIRI